MLHLPSAKYLQLMLSVLKSKAVKGFVLNVSYFHANEFKKLNAFFAECSKMEMLLLLLTMCVCLYEFLHRIFRHKRAI